MCDGARTRAQIANELGLDNGNFSKTLAAPQLPALAVTVVPL